MTPKSVAQAQGTYQPAVPAQPATYREQSANEMFRKLVSHPLYNKLKPETASSMMKFITGIAPRRKEEEPYTLSPGDERYVGGRKIASVPARSAAEKAPKGYSFHTAGDNAYIVNEDTGKFETILDVKPAKNPTYSMVTTSDGKVFGVNNNNPKDIIDTGINKPIEKKGFDTEPEADAEVSRLIKQGLRAAKSLNPAGKWEVIHYSPLAPEKAGSGGETAGELTQSRKNSLALEMLNAGQTTIISNGLAVPYPIKDYGAALGVIQVNGANINDPAIRRALQKYQKPITDNRITVQDSRGKKFSLPASQLQEAIKQGYREVK